MKPSDGVEVSNEQEKGVASLNEREVVNKVVKKHNNDSDQ